MSDSYVDSTLKEQGLADYVSVSHSGEECLMRCASCEKDKPHVDFGAGEWFDECKDCARRRSLYKILGVLDGVANKIDRAAEFDDRSKREHLTELRRLNSLSRDVIADAIFGPRAPGQAHWNSRPVAPPEPHA